jgi:FG-GAP-like repeat
MADITLGQTITGSLTSDDPKYSNGITVYDRYNFVGLDAARQLTIKVNRNLFDGFEIVLRNADTGKIIDYTIDAIGSGDASISATTFPGVNYSLDVSDFNADFSFFTGTYYNISNGFGPYTLSTVDGGKATSIVTTDKVQRNLDNAGIPRIGTVGADGKFFPLASSISSTVTDVAVSPNGQFYGIGGGVFLLRIDPSQQTGDQIQYANGVGVLSIIKDTRGFSFSGSFDAIEFANNKLYALYRTGTGDKLYTIDTTTPAPSITAGYTATLVGDLPAGLLNKGGDMVYDAANRRFLVTAEGLPNNDALWQIPIDNPAGATSIGLTGFADVTGINFENGQLTGFTGGTSPSRISINAATGAGTLDRAISGITGISGAVTIPAATTRNDLNGDGKADILWRNDYGSVALWQMNGSSVTTGSLTSIPNIDPSWKVTGTGDFNGDGKSDVLWRNTNGSIAVWAMNGATVTSSTLTSTPTLDNSWTTAGNGDYNGDGKADILWRNTNGAIVVWAMDGATVTSSTKTSTPSLDNSWKVAGNSDFNGDGKSDILWRNDDGSIALWQMDGAAITSFTAIAKLSIDWKIAGTGDFNGDRKADILWRNDDGRVVLWQMNGAAITSSSLTSTPSRDSSQTVAGIGDYNGDGRADILWRKDTGALDVWQMNGSTVVSSTLTSVAADGSNWKIAAPII